MPIWSTATAGGIPLIKLPNFSATVQEKVFTRTKKSEARVH